MYVKSSEKKIIYPIVFMKAIAGWPVLEKPRLVYLPEKTVGLFCFAGGFPYHVLFHENISLLR